MSNESEWDKLSALLHNERHKEVIAMIADNAVLKARLAEYIDNNPKSYKLFFPLFAYDLSLGYMHTWMIFRAFNSGFVTRAQLQEKPIFRPLPKFATTSERIIINWPEIKDVYPWLIEAFPKSAELENVLIATRSDPLYGEPIGRAIIEDDCDAFHKAFLQLPNEDQQYPFFVSFAIQWRATSIFKYLLLNIGVTSQTITMLTRVGWVEGFGILSGFAKPDSTVWKTCATSAVQGYSIDSLEWLAKNGHITDYRSAFIAAMQQRFVEGLEIIQPKVIDSASLALLTAALDGAKGSPSFQDVADQLGDKMEVFDYLELLTAALGYNDQIALICYAWAVGAERSPFPDIGKNGSSEFIQRVCGHKKLTFNQTRYLLAGLLMRKPFDSSLADEVYTMFENYLVQAAKEQLDMTLFKDFETKTICSVEALQWALNHPKITLSISPPTNFNISDAVRLNIIAPNDLVNRTPWFWASGSVDELTEWIRNGADITTRHHQGHTLLHEMARTIKMLAGNSIVPTAQLMMFRFLVEQGLDPNETTHIIQSATKILQDNRYTKYL